ncbi:hypothetical protein GCM10010967_31440 [Dyadobacter beijingensis]|uniref:Glycosyltransferase RgtA/B/C/D-like domain-containing protein n=1 Tax=Dyadobacter beijingensis TaxID=365489 RepID=A0ABQ2I1D8_9BACT|nr:glycosyltransferase family 39 protein [Dyadobacter beijingensis]GGM95670.1 hypothetical protein GCM10010967_31440 [Dyadobacter beijingensis]
MFVDGLAYAAISRNMAQGFGTFWAPYFADSFWLNYNNLCAFFCEHPPLMFGMQSMLFKIMGDTTAVENCYNALVLAATIVLITLIWRQLFAHNPSLKAQAWLPVLMWYSLRIVWWAVPNNMLDTTMAMFCLAACYTQTRALSCKGNAIGHWILSSLFIFLACLTKGPVGLFPVAFPVLHYLVYKEKPKRVFGGTAILTLTFALLLIITLAYPPANLLLTSYFEGQVMMAILQKREHAGEHWTAHFYLLKMLLVNCIPHLILTGGIWLIARLQIVKAALSDSTKRTVFLNLLIIMSIIGPMSVSIKQSDPYLMPLTPFVAILFAAVSVERIVLWCRQFRFQSRFVFITASVCCVIIMVYSLFNPAWDRMYEVSTDLARHIPAGRHIYLAPDISTSSELQTPLQRYARLSVAFDSTATRYTYLDDPATASDSITASPHFRVVPLAGSAMLVIRLDNGSISAK